MNILDYIPTGHKNAITRHELCIKTGYSDRKVRDLIEEACTREHPILNLQDGRGYFLPDKNEMPLVRLYRNQENRRTASIRKRVSELDKYIKMESDELARNQISLFDTIGGG